MGRSLGRAFLPFIVFASHEARRSLGPDLGKVAALALKAALRGRRGIEIAHQQVRFRSRDYAFSSRIGAAGDLIVEIDLGDPKLADRVVLEDDLRRNGRGKGGDAPGKTARQPTGWRR